MPGPVVTHPTVGLIDKYNPYPRQGETLWTTSGVYPQCRIYLGNPLEMHLLPICYTYGSSTRIQDSGSEKSAVDPYIPMYMRLFSWGDATVGWQNAGLFLHRSWDLGVISALARAMDPGM